MFHQRTLSATLAVCLVLTWGCNAQDDQTADAAAIGAAGSSSSNSADVTANSAPTSEPTDTASERPPAAQGAMDGPTPIASSDAAVGAGEDDTDTIEAADEADHPAGHEEMDMEEAIGAQEPGEDEHENHEDVGAETGPSDADEAPDGPSEPSDQETNDAPTETGRGDHNAGDVDEDPQGGEASAEDESQINPDASPENTEALAGDGNTTAENTQTETERETMDDETLFQDLRTNHWRNIFPNGRRNVGGPQFFKYIYESLATNHDLFARYNQFYCGVSGSVVRPRASGNFDYIKVKDSTGACVVGKYYRCCWPCLCDIMKYGQVEPVQVTLPLDPTNEERTYFVLTVGDPCHECNSSPCADLPPQVQAYSCEDGVTSNGLRVLDGQLTTAAEGRLILAMLHEAEVGGGSDQMVRTDLLDRCTERIEASVEDLSRMGGMGNIFVNLALINNEQTFSNSFSDLCE